MLKSKKKKGERQLLPWSSFSTSNSLVAVATHELRRAFGQGDVGVLLSLFAIGAVAARLFIAETGLFSELVLVASCACGVRRGEIAGGRDDGAAGDEAFHPNATAMRDGHPE